MASFYDDASLVVIPSGYKTSKIYAEKPTDGSGDLTFTRASGATRVGPDGLIEKVRTNNLPYSEAFDNAAWTKVDGSSVVANVAANPLNGAITADRLIIPVTTNARIEQVPPTGWATSGQLITLSCYIKGFSSSGIVGIRSGVVGDSALWSFNASTWTRVTWTKTAGSNYEIPQFCNGTLVSGASASVDILAFGFQIENGDIATAYIPTTTAAVSVGPVSNVPRLDYLGSTCPRLLLEPQRTNSAQYSEQADNAYWLKFQATITANQATAPDGTTSAERLTASGATALIYRTGMTAGALSFFIKAETLSGGARFYIAVDGVGSASWSQNGILFSVTGGTATNAVNYGNGWYRCNFNVTSGSIINFGLENAASGNTAFIWGFQNEASATYATSYVPTTSASVTRVADAASKTGISSLIGQTEGVLFVDYNYEAKPDSSGNIPIVVYTGSSEAYIYITNAGALRFELYNAGSLQALISGTIGAAGRKKIAFAYKQNDFVAYMNGVQIGTDTSGTVGAMASVNIGCYYTSNYSTVSGMNQALLFKTRLTNAQMQELTTL